MAAASIRELGGGKWSVRWREKRPDGSWRPREVVVSGTTEDAEKRRLDVIADLREKGHHDLEAHRVKYAPPASLIDGMRAAINAWQADGLSASSARTYRNIVQPVAEDIHAVTRIPKTDILPVTLLNRSFFDKLKVALGKRGDTVPRTYLRLLWQVWGWLADDTASWPQTPMRPSSQRGYVPQPTVYGRTVAPTPAHADACLRRLRARYPRKSDAMLIGVLMRYTGLRLAQVTGIHREDVDLRAGTLLVRYGKSRQEKADMRVMPVSRHLLAEPVFLAAVRATTAGPLVKISHSTEVLREAWQDASDLDGIPVHVWNPPNRINTRPNHGFRAALQAHLTSERVAHDVIDFLVGHGGGVRSTHYGRDLEDEARKAVDGLPPIDWGVAEAGKVVKMRG